MTLPPTEPDESRDAGIASTGPQVVQAELTLPGAEEPIDAVLVETRHGLPFPGLPQAIAWTLLLLFVQMVVAVVTAVVAIVAQVPMDDLLFALIPIGTATVLFASVALTWALFGRNTGAVLGLRAPRAAHWLLTVMIMLPLVVVAQQIQTWLAQFLPSVYGEEFGAFVRYPLALLILAGCVMPGVGEEIFFRGFIGRGLVARWGFWVGAALTTLLFGLIHIDPLQAAGVLVIGFVFHGLYIATKSLLTAMLGHFLNNLLAFSQMKYGLFATLDYWPIEMGLTATIALAATGMLLYQSRARWILPNGNEWTPGYVSGEAATQTIVNLPASPPDDQSEWELEL